MTHFLSLVKAALFAEAIALSITASASAQTTEVEQSVKGIIAGRGTVDFAGLFSPAGTDLNGKPVEIYLHYLTNHFDRSSNPTGSHDAMKRTGLAGASTIVIMINATRRVAVPQTSATVIDYTKKDDTRFLLQSDFYIEGGTEVSIVYSEPVSFMGLSNDSPALGNNTDYMGFSLASSMQETLNFEVKSFQVLNHLK